MTYENIVAIGENAQDEQFLVWPQYFQLYLTIKLSYMEIFQVFSTMFSKSSATDFVVCGKGLCCQHESQKLSLLPECLITGNLYIPSLHNFFTHSHMPMKFDTSATSEF